MTTVLVLGGVRSGKSAYAERLLRERPAVRYVAAGPAPGPDDVEWRRRVEAHRARRPADWVTVEASAHEHAADADGSADTLDLPAVLGDLDRSGAALVDCLGTWVTRLVDQARAWEDRPRAEALLDRQTERLLETLRHHRGPGAGDVVLVSNEVGLGVVPASASGRLFRDLLGRLNAAVAQACDHTTLVVAGRVLDLSGTPTIDTAPTFGLSGATPTPSDDPDGGDDAVERFAGVEGIDVWADAGLTWTDPS